MKVSDITGMKFNRLLCLKYSHKKKIKNFNGYEHYWVFKCDCGNEKIILGRLVKSGHASSCGCLVHENAGKQHGMSYSRFYSTWESLNSRCNYSKNVKWHRYGGRGIKCLWNSFIEFKNDMYDSYLSHVKEFGEKQTTIDRIDNDGNYCKENCRWATYKEQANNTSRNII